MLHIDINIVTIIHNNVTYSYINATIIIYYNILTLLHINEVLLPFFFTIKHFVIMY